MRVLMLTNLYPTQERPAWGTFVRTQVESLASAGVEAEVFHIEGRRSRLNYLRAIPGLDRGLRNARYDLIHAHYGFSGWIALTQRRLPVVISYMGDDLLGTPRADGSLTRASRLYAWINRRLARRYAAVIVKSPEMRTRLARPDVEVIPNGVDMDFFRPLDRDEARGKLGLAQDAAHVLFAADPAIPRKRFDLARRAVELTAHRRPCRLHAVFGRPQGELLLWMNACDALLFPSWIEGSPNAVKEAMACNLPIVASDAGDIPELLSRGTGNRLVPLAEGPDPEVQAHATAEALQIVLEGGRSTSRFAMEDLSVQSVAKKLRRVYEQVL